MLKGCKNHVAHSAQQFAGSGISTEVGPHNQRIDEEPDDHHRMFEWPAVDGPLVMLELAACRRAASSSRQLPPEACSPATTRVATARNRYIGSATQAMERHRRCEMRRTTASSH